LLQDLLGMNEETSREFEELLAEDRFFVLYII